MTNPIGQTTATLLFIWAESTGSGFLSWAWRVPFAIDGLILVAGIIISYTTKESPLFKSVQEKNAVEKVPALSVFKKFPDRIILVALIQLAFVGPGVVMLNPFSIAFLASKHISVEFATIAVTVGTTAEIFFNYFGSVMGDIIGRRKILFIMCALAAIVSFPFFFLLNTLDGFLIIIAMVMFNFPNQGGSGPVYSYFPEQLPTRYRYSGAGVSYQISGLITGLTVGFMVPAIISMPNGTPNSWPYIALLGVVFGVVGCIACALSKETKGVELEE